MIIFLLKKLRVNTPYNRDKNAQIAAKNNLQKYIIYRQKKAVLTFNINDIADAEAIDFNNDSNINNVSSSKSAQIAAKRLLKNMKNYEKTKLHFLSI